MQFGKPTSCSLPRLRESLAISKRFTGLSVTIQGHQTGAKSSNTVSGTVQEALDLVVQGHIKNVSKMLNRMPKLYTPS